LSYAVWHESDRPLDETNTTYQLEKSRDWIQFTLDQPMDAAPGTKWTHARPIFEPFLSVLMEVSPK
jgi:hypothetical protein